MDKRLRKLLVRELLAPFIMSVGMFILAMDAFLRGFTLASLSLLLLAMAHTVFTMHVGDILIDGWYARQHMLERDRRMP